MSNDVSEYLEERRRKLANYQARRDELLEQISRAERAGRGSAVSGERTLVRDMMGKIEAVSGGADQGTTVSIYLPLRSDAPQPEPSPDD